MMDCKLIIFDVDGTLVTTASGATFRKNAADWQWLPKRVEKLQALVSQGIHLGIATNQGGVAFGYMQSWDIGAELLRMADAIPIHHEMVSVCCQHPQATIDLYRMDSERRKPGPGMLIELMGLADVTASDTLMVGDRPEDEQAAQNAGVAFMWADEFFRESEPAP